LPPGHLEHFRLDVEQLQSAVGEPTGNLHAEEPGAGPEFQDVLRARQTDLVDDARRLEQRSRTGC
jgi:hypothetical protein